MLMFFKYYKAQKENDIKSLELNVFGKLKNNINTTPMIVLLKNVSNIDMNEH